MGPIQQCDRVNQHCMAQRYQTCMAGSSHYSLCIIPGLCDTIPLVDLFYKCMLNFVNKCLSLRSNSTLVNFIVRHGIFYGEMDSIIGRNILN